MISKVVLILSSVCFLFLFRLSFYFGQLPLCSQPVSTLHYILMFSLAVSVACSLFNRFILPLAFTRFINFKPEIPQNKPSRVSSPFVESERAEDPYDVPEELTMLHYAPNKSNFDSSSSSRSKHVSAKMDEEDLWWAPTIPSHYTAADLVQMAGITQAYLFAALGIVIVCVFFDTIYLYPGQSNCPILAPAYARGFNFLLLLFLPLVLVYIVALAKVAGDGRHLLLAYRALASASPRKLQELRTT